MASATSPPPNLTQPEGPDHRGQRLLQEPRHDRLAHGLCVRPEPVIQQMLKLHQFGIMSAPTTSQYAAVEAMRNGDPDIEHMPGGV